MNDHSSRGVLKGKERARAWFPKIKLSTKPHLQFVEDREIAEYSLRQGGEVVVFQGPLGVAGT